MFEGQFFPIAPLQFEGGWPIKPQSRKTFLEAITSLSLTSNLTLCLDAGDSASFTSGQSWLDRSGGGYDFFLGDNNSVTATDPTFTGTAGNRSSSEYFAFDGGDYFTYDTTNETWMQNIHKDNANFTIICWVYVTSTSNTQGFIGTRGAAGSGNTGFTFFADGLQLNFSVQNAGTSVILLASGTQLVTNQWNFVAVSLNEATGANGAFIQRNATQTSFTSTYSSPAAGNATNTLQIACRGAGNFPFLNNGRMGVCAAWTTALTTTQVNNIYDATRGKYGI